MIAISTTAASGRHRKISEIMKNPLNLALWINCRQTWLASKTVKKKKRMRCFVDRPKFRLYDSGLHLSMRTTYHHWIVGFQCCSLFLIHSWGDRESGALLCNRNIDRSPAFDTNWWIGYTKARAKGRECVTVCVCVRVCVREREQGCWCWDVLQSGKHISYA